WEELLALAGEPVARWFGALPQGNWEGTNVLWIPPRALDDADPAGPDLESARSRLLAARQQRVRPATDDKVLAGWNGLAIAAFAEAGRILGEPRYVDAAVAAADFVLTRLRRVVGRLLRSWRAGRAGGPGSAADCP